MKKSLPLLVIIPLLLTGCNNPSNGKDNVVTKSINVNYVNSKNNTKCNIHYYGNSVIPYISLKDFHQLLYRGRTFEKGRDRFDVKQEGDVYTCTVDGGYTATFDVKNNIMESDNLWFFRNTNLYSADKDHMVCYDGLPFTRIKNVTIEGTPKKVTINFDKYNMKIYGDNNAIYVPITFATDLFANENILQGAYNTKELFFFYYTENEELNAFGSKYTDPMFSGSLNKEYVNYYYNELCLCYDYFQGRPGRSSLEVYYDLSNGLDAALKARPLGKLINEYLNSTDLTKLLAGSMMLGYLRYDGGHSYYFPIDTTYIDKNGNKARPSWYTDKVASGTAALFADARAKGYEELINYDSGFYKHADIYAARNKELGKEKRALKGTETYTKVGDTAYIHIDGFMNEIYQRAEWDKYYNGQRDTIPFGQGVGGAVGAITYGVKEAAKDDEVKHLVVDLSANTGGSTDEMLFMVGLLTGSKHMYTHNTMIDTYFDGEFEFDFNFDKKFDEKDDEMLKLTEGMDITVLTTKSAFSCGGISPIYLHDNGLFTVGDECGGGSCSIYMQYDAFGGLNRASSPVHTVTKDKVSIDVARRTVCDYKYEFKQVTEEVEGVSKTYYDFSQLFNTESLRKLINEYYK